MAKRQVITDALRRAVRKSGKTMYVIGGDAGVNFDSLSRFMRGKTSLRLDVADKLAGYFGLKVV